MGTQHQSKTWVHVQGKRAQQNLARPHYGPKRAPFLGIGAIMCCASGGLGSAAVNSHIALTMGVHAQGNWRWVNEAKPGAQPKWGYVSTVPGDRLTLRVTRDPEPGLAGSLRHSRVTCLILTPSNPSETLWGATCFTGGRAQ